MFKNVACRPPDRHFFVASLSPSFFFLYVPLHVDRDSSSNIKPSELTPVCIFCSTNEAARLARPIQSNSIQTKSIQLTISGEIDYETCFTVDFKWCYLQIPTSAAIIINLWRRNCISASGADRWSLDSIETKHLLSNPIRSTGWSYRNDRCFINLLL